MIQDVFPSGDFYSIEGPVPKPQGAFSERVPDILMKKIPELSSVLTNYRNNGHSDLIRLISARENNTEGACGIFDHHHSNADGINTSEEMVEASGKLYNWYAVDDPRGLCPECWIVPDDDDWTQLVDFIADSLVSSTEIHHKKAAKNHIFLNDQVLLPGCFM